MIGCLHAWCPGEGVDLLACFLSLSFCCLLTFGSTDIYCICYSSICEKPVQEGVNSFSAESIFREGLSYLLHCRRPNHQYQVRAISPMFVPFGSVGKELDLWSPSNSPFEGESLPRWFGTRVSDILE